MADHATDEQHPIPPEPAPDRPWWSPQRKSRIPKILALILIIAGFGLAYRLGTLDSFFRGPTPGLVPDKLRPAFTQVPEEDLFSSDTLLEGVGKIAAKPSSVTVAPREPAESPEISDKPESCPPAAETTAPVEPPAVKEAPGTAASTAPEAAEPLEPAKPAEVTTPAEPPKHPEVKTVPPFSPGLIETPVAPGKEAPAKSGDALSTYPTPARTGRRSVTGPRKAPGEGPEAERASAAKKRTAATGAAEPDMGAGPGREDDKGRERFQVPGSLTVKIRDYEGTEVKWGLMIILDDSATMAKKMKPWQPTRSKAAATLVEKLHTALTQGSKLAVRDFFCNPEAKKPQATCPSRMLFGWGTAPFNQLHEKLESLGSGGKTDPCAAAAFALTKDLAGLGDLSPRILLLTNGPAKCSHKEVINAIGHFGAKKPILDIIGFGMGVKQARAYSGLAKKTGGEFLPLEQPGAIEKVLARYGKILKARVMEKVEIRGDKSVFTCNPGEEITLAPGTYTVQLPLVNKVNPAKRTLPSVKIDSGESKLLDVRIKSGRPVVQTGKK